jgi:hypothetical protein
MFTDVVAVIYNRIMNIVITTQLLLNLEGLCVDARLESRV